MPRRLAARHEGAGRRDDRLGHLHRHPDEILIQAPTTKWRGGSGCWRAESVAPEIYQLPN
jgi:hypothetical protein